MTPLELLAAAQTTLHAERDDIVRLLTEAEACAASAVVHFTNGQHKQAKERLTAGCDLEYEALADCEALGALSEALYPGEEES